MASNIYMGLAFPFGKSATSFPAAAEDDALIKQEMEQLLLTSKGQRVMRNDLGADVQSFVFESNDVLLESNIRTVVLNAFARFDPRVIVRQVTVERTGATPNNLENVTPTISYVVPATQTEGTVAVEFPTNQVSGI